ncbi:MAG: hypothetical protein QOJ57_1521 [Thermoleophilaceae bacterium]|nr:hypothetical protein [Thermoleophilaceae bacterium]
MPTQQHVPPPVFRKLRVFAFDPSAGTELDTAGVNEVTLRVPWEGEADGSGALSPGPVGEYLEVIDVDPASGCAYRPVDLNNASVLAQDGLTPSEADPQFHQQMVYAVAMRIIRDFERVLGRVVLWSPRMVPGGKGAEAVTRLRVYPHALREANAYYSPSKKALLFGYFPSSSGTKGGQLTVFTCLSHDIIAHEVTHALLDGIHRRFNEPSNPDMLAFHEAFADIVALFEHFSLPSVLRHQIAATRGDLASQNRLGELARQFGEAIGKRGALRSAIGRADPEAYQHVVEPHDRGAILVGAVFDAFLTIYKSRVADLLRIATQGTGVLPAGQLHPDLVDRLADEAAKSARRVLEMSIRALDYCPPVDITFGDYLRALITASYEDDPVDDSHSRVAFVEAFRRYGIVPEDIRSLSVDGLLWRPASDAPDVDEAVVLEPVKEWGAHIGSWSVTRNREEVGELTRTLARSLHDYLEPLLEDKSVALAAIDPASKFEVHSLRPARATGWNGELRFRWVIELTQRIPEYYDKPQPGQPADFYFRGGCTLLVDAQTGRIAYSIRKPLSESRKKRQLDYVLGEGNEGLAATYFGGVTEAKEPFAMLHRF